MGRAIVREPKVFLMDEPLSNLDAKLRVQMRTEIAKLHRRLQATVIYVTHDQTEAMTLGTRIVVMKDGVIQQTDSPEQLYNSPRNIFVAGFIDTQMNFIEMKVKKTGNDLFLHNTAFDINVPEEKNKALRPYIGKPIIAGLRAESIHISQNSVNFAVVEMIEQLGAETNLYLNIGGISITAKINSPSRVKVGDKVGITINRRQVYTFDRETELVIGNKNGL